MADYVNSQIPQVQDINYMDILNSVQLPEIDTSFVDQKLQDNSMARNRFAQIYGDYGKSQNQKTPNMISGIANALAFLIDKTSGDSSRREDASANLTRNLNEHKTRMKEADDKNRQTFMDQLTREQLFGKLSDSDYQARSTRADVQQKNLNNKVTTANNVYQQKSQNERTNVNIKDRNTLSPMDRYKMKQQEMVDKARTTAMQLYTKGVSWDSMTDEQKIAVMNSGMMEYFPSIGQQVSQVWKEIDEQLKEYSKTVEKIVSGDEELSGDEKLQKIRDLVSARRMQLASEYSQRSPEMMKAFEYLLKQYDDEGKPLYQGPSMNMSDDQISELENMNNLPTSDIIKTSLIGSPLGFLNNYNFDLEQLGYSANSLLNKSGHRTGEYIRDNIGKIPSLESQFTEPKKGIWNDAKLLRLAINAHNSNENDARNKLRKYIKEKYANSNKKLTYQEVLNSINAKAIAK